MSKKEEKKRKIEWERHCFAVSLVANLKNMSKKDTETIKMRLPIRVEYPDTSRLGRLWQRIRCRLGSLRLLSREQPFHSLFLQDRDKLSRLLYMPCTYDILQKREIKIIKSFQQLSETEERGIVSIYLEKRLEYLIKWHLTLSDDGLELSAVVPVPLLYPLILDSSRAWYFVSDNVS